MGALYDQTDGPEWKGVERLQDLWEWRARRAVMRIVKAAIRKVGLEANVRTMRSEALRMLVDEIWSLPAEEAGWWDQDDISTAIKYLINYEHYRESERTLQPAEP